MAKKKATTKADAPETDQTQPEPSKAAPHTVNSSLSSDRMKNLLKDHQAMGARPK